MPLGKSRIRHLAGLARLNLNDTEIDRLDSQLEFVVDHFNCLREVDTSSIEPGAGLPASNALRVDAVAPSLDCPQALANGPDHDGEYFHVPGVIRR